MDSPSLGPAHFALGQQDAMSGQLVAGRRLLGHCTLLSKSQGRDPRWVYVRAQGPDLRRVSMRAHSSSPLDGTTNLLDERLKIDSEEGEVRSNATGKMRRELEVAIAKPIGGRDDSKVGLLVDRATQNGKPASKSRSGSSSGDSPPKSGDSSTFGGANAAKNRMPEAGGVRQLPAVLRPMSIGHILSEDQDLRKVICNAADSFVTSVLAPLSEHKQSVNPTTVLRGICAPVPETPPTRCHVVSGEIPADLSGGVYLRNGPNASSIHEGDGYHMFDGEGMLHAVTLTPEKGPIYCSRFVQTRRFRQEQEAGRPLMVKFFGGMSDLAGVARTAVTGLRAVFGLLDLTDGFGLSNTSVCYFNGHILSLSEDDMPYIIKVSEHGELSTVGRFRLPLKSNMCAHPKLDPITGELYAFSLNVPFLPPFSFFRLSADGTKSGDVPVPLLDVPLVHDFAITNKYVILPDNQLVIRPWEMVKSGSPLVSDPGKTPRFCLLPRYALPEESPAAATWFDVPGVNCMHYVNAWEEDGGEEVVIVAPVLSPIDRALQMEASCTLTKVRLNTKTSKVKKRSICDAGGEHLEFGVINPNFTGKKTRYAYLATGTYPRLTGIVKVDLTQEQGSSVVGKRDFSSTGCFGGEPFFVPAKDALSEDHGYLLCFVGDENRDVSHLLIMDALSPALETVASIEIPSRVPPGFHGCFVTAKQLSQQRH